MSFQKRTAVLIVFVLCNLFAACANREYSQEPQAAQKIPDAIWSTISAFSDLATELGPSLGPPSPGALSGQNCISANCSPGPQQLATSREFRACKTGFGQIDGRVVVSVKDHNDLRGCATSVGPAEFQTWPPKEGIIQIQFIDFTRTYTTRQDLLLSGQAKFRWGGRPTSALTLDLESCYREDSRSSAALCFRLSDDGDLSADISKFNPESGSRSFNGRIRAEQIGSTHPYTLILDNLQFKRRNCCHPVSGRIILDRFLIQFGKACGEAEVEDELGQRSTARLPSC